MQRILVIGSAGSGKSYFGRALAERLGVEVIHLDQHFWGPGWCEPSHPVWDARLEELLARPAWVMEGSYTRTLQRRLQACDTAIFLDLPRWLCMWRVLWRIWTTRGQVRFDMAPGCPEQFHLGFLGLVWGYPARSRPKVLALLEQRRGAIALYRLRSRREVRQFLAGRGQCGEYER